MSRSRKRRPARDTVDLVIQQPVWLELPGSGLQVIADNLVCWSSDETALFRIPLAAIENVSLRRRIQWAGVRVIIFALGMGAIGAFVSESSILTAILYVVALGLLLIGGVGSIRKTLLIRVTGKLIGVPLGIESAEHAIGFIVSLQEAVRTSKRLAAEMANQDAPRMLGPGA